MTGDPKSAAYSRLLEAERSYHMLLLPRLSFLSIAAVCALVALTASNNSPQADDLVQNLGPVRPYEPILAPARNKRLVAFYAPSRGACAIDVAVRNNSSPN